MIGCWWCWQDARSTKLLYIQLCSSIMGLSPAAAFTLSQAWKRLKQTYLLPENSRSLISEIAYSSSTASAFAVSPLPGVMGYVQEARTLEKHCWHVVWFINTYCNRSSSGKDVSIRMWCRGDWSQYETHSLFSIYKGNHEIEAWPFFTAINKILCKTAFLQSVLARAGVAWKYWWNSSAIKTLDSMAPASVFNTIFW